MLYPVAHAARFMQGLGLMDPDPLATLMRQFEGHASRRPDKLFLLFEDRRYSYAAANAEINRYAHSYRKLGIGRGDVVALLIENRPEFFWHLFGLNKLGAIGSLVNTHLVGESLVHAIRICQPSHVVIGSELWAEFASIRERLPELANAAIEVDVDMSTDGPRAFPVASWNDRLPGAAISNPLEATQVVLSDQAAFIYTSGTTGLPKAAVVRHSRMFRGGAVWAGLGFRFRDDDLLYNCLPLYHANALILATASVISAGITMALARRFSRTRFWDDARRYEATAFIYIGELCRYLMNNPTHPSDRDHRVRVISGNGLRPDIWRSFQQRFGLKRISEFYGSTEGNCITINALGVEGSCGTKLPGMALVRWDEDANDFVRDAHGRLVEVKTGETGVLLGKIRRRAEFDGYQDKAASEGKIVRDAFVPGDAWFNTGDLLRCDRGRNLFFVDRLGDTYRWKGENVATSEVQERLSEWSGVQEANVYGVSVPGMEGRAGMAAIVLNNGRHFDPGALRQHIRVGLPPFAQPQFIRIMPALSTTSTFKLKKGDLQKEGFDPRSIRDPLYLLNPRDDQYVPLSPELYDEVVAGRLRL
jgi:acyl-CoA synthetase (AMP-forming)/AMP-acid ligase II